jgi:ABC-type nitrate/sulfonate/bicarbonate transport system permease component
MARRGAILGLLVPALVLALWEILGRADVLSDDGFSRISRIMPAAVHGLADGTMLQRTWETLSAAATGWAIAAAIGIPLGLLIGLVRPLERLLSVTIEALRPVPSAALIPIALLIFGFSLQMGAAVAAFACLWPILILTAAAARGIEPRLLELGRALGFGAIARVWRLALPAALPGIAVGLRIAFGIAIVVTVTVEIVANPRGLGYAMITAQQSLRTDVMYAYLFWTGIVGWLINLAMTRAERYALHWYWSSRGME